MKSLSVIELAKLYGMNRQSIYKRINKGDLSKNSDGKIDLSEAIRVFGEPSQRSNANVAAVQSPTLQKSAEVDILTRQVDMLQKQLELAQEREVFQREELKAKNEQIESLQRLLGAPKEQQKEEQHPSEPTGEEVSVEPEPIVHATSSKPEPKRRSLFGRVIRAVLD
jgi:polyhydroxyalkanoate synthesis regulator phasin